MCECVYIYLYCQYQRIYLFTAIQNIVENFHNTWQKISFPLLIHDAIQFEVVHSFLLIFLDSFSYHRKYFLLLLLLLMLCVQHSVHKYTILSKDDRGKVVRKKKGDANKRIVFPLFLTPTKNE